MRDDAAVRRHIAQTKVCRDARIAKLNDIRANVRPPLREINLNGDWNAPLPNEDAVVDVEMGDAILDHAADEIFRDNEQLAPPVPQDDMQPPQPLPAIEVREVYTIPYGRNAGEPSTT